MVLVKKARSVKQANEVIKKMTPEELREIIEAELQRLSEYSVQDLLCLTSFFEYLTTKSKDKVFLTNSKSLVAKHKETLEKTHCCKIKIAEALK